MANSSNKSEFACSAITNMARIRNVNDKVST